MKNFLKVNISRYILLLVLAMGFPAWLSAQKALPAESLKSRIERIASTSGRNIVYDDKSFGNIQVAAVAVESNNINTLLTKSLASTGFTFKTMPDNSIVIKKGEQKPTQSPAPVKGKGSLSGTVLDEAGQPFTGVIVSIPGTTIGIATDADGKYTLRGVPEGTTKVQFAFMGYETQVVSDVKINANRATPLDIVLKESSQQLGEVVVTATYNQASANGLYAKQKNMAAMSDGVSADMIKKTSDNNVAQVLKRVSGVTIDDGKYVTVRGLSERYNNVQLNGSALPSTEPNRRNFSFDVIPSGLVDNVTIAKTFTPDMQGEFTGGLVEVNTLAIPNEQVIQLSAGAGFNTFGTGKDFWSGKRYAGDYLFGNTNDRQWFAGQDTEEQVTQSIENAVNKNSFGLRKYKAAPMQNYALTVGKPFNLGNGNTLGIVAALTYRNEQSVEEYKEMRSYKYDSLAGPGFRYNFTTSTGAVLNAGWRNRNHSITLRNLFNNRFEHSNLERYVWSYSTGTDFYEQYSAPLQARLWQTQLDGRHELFGERLIASWAVSYNKVTRINPDDRYANGAVMGGDMATGEGLVAWSNSPSGSEYALSNGHLMYSNLTEDKTTAKFDLEYPLTVAGNRQVIKAGYMGTFRNADYKQKYLRPQGGGPVSSSMIPIGSLEEYQALNARYLDLQDYYNPENFESGAIYYIAASVNGPAYREYYTGDQRIHAAYLMGEFTFLRKFHLTAGVRMENANTKLNTTIYTFGLGNQDSVIVVKKNEFLPAATLVYNITDEFNARAAYSRTIARPDFRELAFSKYYNVNDRIVVEGRPLEQSYTDNYDLRLEWYPAAGEVVSVSAFYKSFHKPVELVTRQTNDLDYVLSPYNLKDATVKGLEFNLRKSLGFIAQGSFLRDMYFSGNLTLLQGNVVYNQQDLRQEESGGQAESNPDFDRNRPLQGLAPYTVNAGLMYQGTIFGAAVNYGRDGRKLLFAGLESKFDEYEAPRDVLDLQLSARLLKKRNLELKFNVSDLFHQDMVRYRNTRREYSDPTNPNAGGTNLDLTDDMNYNAGDYVLSRLKRGMNITLGVSYKF